MFGFKGSTFVPERDGARLSSQLAKVKDLMLDGEWRSLETIAELTGSPEASVSARLRDLRRMGYVVERRFINKGLHLYAVRLPPEDPAENAT
jgi:biotin operon repressor